MDHLEYLEEQVFELRATGALPVVTFQYNESYGMVPGFEQERDFPADVRGRGSYCQWKSGASSADV